MKPELIQVSGRGGSLFDFFLLWSTTKNLLYMYLSSLQRSQVTHQATPTCSRMEQLGAFLLPPWMGRYSIAGLSPASHVHVKLHVPVFIYAPGQREAP